MHFQIIMDTSGDTRHQFDPEDASALAEAEKRFRNLVEAGFIAAKRTGNGTSELSTTCSRGSRSGRREAPRSWALITPFSPSMKPAEKGRVVSVRTDGPALHHHSASRARTIAGLSGFLTFNQSRGTP
jgi:hypothetical protein